MNERYEESENDEPETLHFNVVIYYFHKLYFEAFSIFWKNKSIKSIFCINRAHNWFNKSTSNISISLENNSPWQEFNNLSIGLRNGSWTNKTCLERLIKTSYNFNCSHLTALVYLKRKVLKNMHNSQG